MDNEERSPIAEEQTSEAPSPFETPDEDVRPVEEKAKDEDAD